MTERGGLVRRFPIPSAPLGVAPRASKGTPAESETSDGAGLLFGVLDEREERIGDGADAADRDDLRVEIHHALEHGVSLRVGRELSPTFQSSACTTRRPPCSRGARSHHHVVEREADLDRVPSRARGAGWRCPWAKTLRFPPTASSLERRIFIRGVGRRRVQNRRLPGSMRDNALRRFREGRGDSAGGVVHPLVLGGRTAPQPLVRTGVAVVARLSTLPPLCRSN